MRRRSQALGTSLKKVSSFELNETQFYYTFLRGWRSIFLSYFEVNNNPIISRVQWKTTSKREGYGQERKPLTESQVTNMSPPSPSHPKRAARLGTPGSGQCLARSGLAP